MHQDNAPYASAEVEVRVPRRLAVAWAALVAAASLVLAVALPVAVDAMGGSLSDLVGPKPAFAADEDQLSWKTLTPNGDGTYDLAINVKGTSSSSETQAGDPVDIVLVLDVSWSMKEPLPPYTVVKDPQPGKTYLIDVNGKKHRVQYVTDKGTGTSGWKAPTYSGAYLDPNKFEFLSGTPKIDALKTAVSNFLDATAAQNKNITSDAGKIDVSIVKFSQPGVSTAIVSGLTSDMSALKQKLNALAPFGATYSQDGLRLASEVLNGPGARKNAKKYVLFFTDGEPSANNGFNADFANQAIKISQDMKSEGTQIFSVGVADGADPSANPAEAGTSNINKFMQAVSSDYPDAAAFDGGDWTPANGYEDGYYKTATTADELNAVFAGIFNNISTTTVMSNFSVTDNLTSMTSAKLDEDGRCEFRYTTTDADGNTTDLADFPEATLNDKKIEWKLGDKVLEPGVTYTVHLTVWPDQDAHDLVADLNNGKLTYDQLTDAQKSQLKQRADGSYELMSNTPDGNKVTYDAVTTSSSQKQPEGTLNSDGTVTTSDGTVYTKNPDGSWSGTKVTRNDVPIENPKNGMTVPDGTMTVVKTWVGGTPKSGALTAAITRDGAKDLSVDLSAANDWKATSHVAAGIITVHDGDMQVLEKGHDYTVAELGGDVPEFDLYELVNPNYRVMLVNDVMTTLVKTTAPANAADGYVVADDATYYQIDGSWYKTSGAAEGVFKFENARKSSLALGKTVVAKNEGEKAPAETLFTFSVTMTDPNGAPVRFRILNREGKPVTDASRVSGAAKFVGSDGGFEAESGKGFQVRIKAGDSVSFSALATGTTYRVEEVMLAEGFSVKSATANVGAQGLPAEGATVSGAVVSGTVAQRSADYQVFYTNEYAKPRTPEPGTPEPTPTPDPNPGPNPGPNPDPGPKPKADRPAPAPAVPGTSDATSSVIPAGLAVFAAVAAAAGALLRRRAAD